MNFAENAGAVASVHTMKRAGAIHQNPDEEAVSTGKTRFIPLTEWPKYHPWPPIGGLRHLMFYRETNGFADAFIKRGRRVLVNETKFFQLVLAEQQ